MSKYGSSLIGLDMKPRKKAMRRNRFVTRCYGRIFPVILGLVVLGLIAVAGEALWK